MKSLVFMAVGHLLSVSVRCYLSSRLSSAKCCLQQAPMLALRVARASAGAEFERSLQQALL